MLGSDRTPQPPRARTLAGWAFACLALGPLAAGAAEAERPLHELIDYHVEAGFARRKIVPAPPAAEAEFLRRAYLDLTGTIPAAAEVAGHLADARPSRRADLVARLLDSPEHARHLARVLCGGELSLGQWVSEQHLLDLEREAFLALLKEPKTMERIQGFLMTRKVIRN